MSEVLQLNCRQLCLTIFQKDVFSPSDLLKEDIFSKKKINGNLGLKWTVFMLRVCTVTSIRINVFQKRGQWLDVG